jgi:hypothetical protein
MIKENTLQIRNSSAAGTGRISRRCETRAIRPYGATPNMRIVGEGCPLHLPACKPSRAGSGRISMGNRDSPYSLKEWNAVQQANIRTF